MKESNYSNKLMSEDNKVTKKTQKVEKAQYVLISPKGNQYVVSADKLEQFKSAHNVGKDWTIK